jgi:endonuclease/exonuclease/phosphatase family metal-dependent hydrolase
MPSLATFNANNLFLRYRFSDTYPGDLSKKSKAEAAEAMGWGFLPQIADGKFSSKSYVFWDDARRKATAQALEAVDGKLPDILCLQEVESMAALRKFNDDHLGGHYTNFMLVDGLDLRQIDVAVASVWPIIDVRSHVDLFAKNGERIFSRDCLEVTIVLPDGAPLTLFVNHLKSKLSLGKTQAQKDADTRRAHALRRRQAETVARLVQERMAGKTTTALYAVVGDFNDTPTSPSVTPLSRHRALTDIVSAYLPPAERYTYFWRTRNRVSQIDHVLASKALAERIAGRAKKNKLRKPHIERSGLGFVFGSGANADKIREPLFTFFEPDAAHAVDADGKAPAPVKVPFAFDRLPSVQKDPKQPVSDHAPVKVWF